MKNRIKELRESRGVIQSVLADEIGVTQQMFSRYERNVMCIKADALIKLANYFNVTTDYLLGVSDMKRDLQGQLIMNSTLDQYYNLVEVYKTLDQYDRDAAWEIIQLLKKISLKRQNSNKIMKREEHPC